MSEGRHATRAEYKVIADIPGLLGYSNQRPKRVGRGRILASDTDDNDAGRKRRTPRARNGLFEGYGSEHTTS